MMRRNMKSFLDGYAKAITLFPNTKDGLSSDWVLIGQDVGVALNKYTQMQEKKIWKNPKTSKSIAKKKRKLTK